MPIKFKGLGRVKTVGTKTVTVVFGDESMNVDFRIGALSPRKLTAMQTAKPEDMLETTVDFLDGVLSRWEVEDDKGKVIPIDRETLMGMPVDFLAAIAEAINADVTVPKESMTGSFAG
jgi:hypothetical protein